MIGSIVEKFKSTLCGLLNNLRQSSVSEYKLDKRNSLSDEVASARRIKTPEANQVERTKRDMVQRNQLWLGADYVKSLFADSINTHTCSFHSLLRQIRETRLLRSFMLLTGQNTSKVTLTIDPKPRLNIERLQLVIFSVKVKANKHTMEALMLSYRIPDNSNLPVYFIISGQKAKLAMLCARLEECIEPSEVEELIDGCTSSLRIKKEFWVQYVRSLCRQDKSKDAKLAEVVNFKLQPHNN